MTKKLKLTFDTTDLQTRVFYLEEQLEKHSMHMQSMEELLRAQTALLRAQAEQLTHLRTRAYHHDQ